MTTGAISRAGRDDWGKLVLRVTVAGLLLLHGIFKVKNGVAWIGGPLSAVGLPAFLAYGVYVGEVIAPIFVIVGKFTRIAALIMAFDLLMAILLVQRERIFMINPQGGGLGVELETFFCLGSVAIALLGSGRYALSKGQGRWD